VHDAEPDLLSGGSAGELFQLVRTGRAATRSELGRLTGLSRTAVNARLDDLRRLDLVVETGRGPSTGGRPAGRVDFHPRGGVVLAVALGLTRSQLAVCDLSGDALSQVSLELDLTQGPAPVLDRVGSELEQLLRQAGRTSDAVRGTGLALPGPVEASAGWLVRPPGLPGWSEVPVRPHLARRWPVPTSVDNDVNAMAVAEHRAGGYDDATDVLLVKVSTGIGAGLVLGGRIHRGAVGAAGDIGHTAVHDADGTVCRCGNVGCLEAVASGSAVVRQLAARGYDVTRVADVVALVEAGDAEAHGLVRLAGRRLGEVLAQAVNLLNPSVLVLAGDLALAQEPLLAGVREAVYARATTLAVRDLDIRPGTLGEQAGLVGCAVTVLDQVLAADAVDRELARLPGRSGDVPDRRAPAARRS
jgi:predicted NBD/HSP70 family sugar kinase